EETLKLPNSHWATCREQVALLQLLVQLQGAKRILEVGTFTGYATLAFALALPDDGRIVTCDVASGWSEMGVHYWRDAGVEARIDRRLGFAENVMTELLKTDEGRFDLIYLDADKRSYTKYLELAVDLLRQGGLLIADDVFWHGEVLELGNSDMKASGVRDFNAQIHEDERFDIAMIPIADGMTLAIKR
ncbi:MAG: O-methyltransferase, partial [Alphaproteobacteria bacterium]